jgi:NADH-quinone oxidoreductase subunit J
MLEAIAFYTLAAMILGLGILVITARSAVHSVLFLVLNFLFVAALYVTLNAEFLAVIQIMVYAGGIVVLYLFVVMLVNLKRAPEQHADPRRLGVIGMLLAGVVLLELVAIAVYSDSRDAVSTVASAARVFPDRLNDPLLNTEQLGWVLYTDYLIPFELASMLLLVAMIGAIVLAKRDA